MDARKVRRHRGASFAAALLLGLGALTAVAADAPSAWDPSRYAGESTIVLGTTAPGEAEHWFPVWVVVLDGEVYVRLGNRAAGRIHDNTTQPYVGVRIAGQEFDRVRYVEVPDRAAQVAQAMADKYWSDFMVRHFSHPLTLRLRPE